MGYACPVCGDPQADAEHLANHLAFTALRGESDHESWLSEHAPDWDQQNAESLATTVVEHAEEVEFPQVFEDTTGDHDHSHDDERSGALFDDEANLPGGSQEAVERERRDRELDAQAEQALEDAREMTRQLMKDGTEDGEPNEQDADDQDADADESTDEQETDDSE